MIFVFENFSHDVESDMKDQLLMSSENIIRAIQINDIHYVYQSVNIRIISGKRFFLKFEKSNNPNFKIQ